MNINFSFIIIDDSELDRYITQKFLELADKRLDIKTFQSAEVALEMIREEYLEKRELPTIIFLDLLMPMMTGHKFVEEFEKLPVEIKGNFMIVILTLLSVDSHPDSIYGIPANAAINSIIEKPLTREKLTALLERIRSANA